MQSIQEDIREVWKYRSLLRMLVVRDLKARYKNSVLGIAWSFLQPLGMMVVLSFAFTQMNRSDGTDRPNVHVLILAGYLAWTFFSASVVGGAGSVVSNGGLVKKVYFPRILLPIASVVSNLINYTLALPMFGIVAVLSGARLHETLLLLPLAIFLQAVMSTGFAMMLSTLNVFYRDTQFIVDLGMLALFFVTPIWYDVSAIEVTGFALWVRRLNPMASLVNIYQELMYHGRVTALDFWLRTAVTAVAILVIGYAVFRRYQARMAEEL
jgi:lipopolysaccharide transport system permease protein